MARRNGKQHHARLVAERGITGYDPLRLCGACSKCIAVTKSGGGRVWKCTLVGVTASKTTDWRRGWLACGAFSEKDSNEPQRGPRPDAAVT